MSKLSLFFHFGISSQMFSPTPSLLSWVFFYFSLEIFRGFLGLRFQKIDPRSFHYSLNRLQKEIVFFISSLYIITLLRLPYMSYTNCICCKMRLNAERGNNYALTGDQYTNTSLPFHDFVLPDKMIIDRHKFEINHLN